MPARWRHLQLDDPLAAGAKGATDPGVDAEVALPNPRLLLLLHSKQEAYPGERRAMDAQGAVLGLGVHRSGLLGPHSVLRAEDESRERLRHESKSGHAHLPEHHAHALRYARPGHLYSNGNHGLHD